MAEFQVTASTLKQKAEELSTLNNNFAKKVEELMASEKSLSGMWEGQAKEAFENAFNTDAGKMNYEILADRVRYFKEDEKGVATMSRVMEEMRNETERAKAIKDAKGMLESGKLTYEEIAKIAELTIDEVRALDKKVTA